MKKWYCLRCGYIHEGDAPPDVCPVCGVPADMFELREQADKADQPQQLTSYEADVLVVGSGAAAFASAITARAAGARVIMLEKADNIGGTTMRSGGGYWVPLNHWQKQAGYSDNRESALRYMARYSYPHLYQKNADYLGLPKQKYDLLTAYVDNAHKMADYFEDVGALHSIAEINWTGKAQVDYMDHLPENEGIRGRTIYPKDQNGKLAYGSELIRQMEYWAKEHDVDILTGHTVNRILQKEGRISGLEVEANGEIEIFTASRGVIFGSGGYPHNPDLMLQFQRGPHYGGCSAPTNTGDFIRMAGSIGARLGNMSGAFRAESMIEQALKNPGGSSNVFYLIGDSMLLVNKYGNRIFDEKRNYTDRTMLHFVWDPVRAEWTNMLTFMLFDERCANLWQGFPPFPKDTKDVSYLIKADSLEDIEAQLHERLEKLAPHTGSFKLDDVFGNNLKATVSRFNNFAETGVDEDFHRGESAYDREWTTFPPAVPDVAWPPEGTKNHTMYPLSKSGPYYAIILAAGTLDTNGGPTINEHAQVLDWKDEPIPGLYGAGNCIASPTANAYWGAGSTIGPALTYGYIAANHLMGG